MLRAARCAAVRAARSPALARNIATYGAASPMPAIAAAARARRSPLVAAVPAATSGSVAGGVANSLHAPRRGFASLKSRTVVEAKAVSATSGVAKHVGEKMETKGAGDTLDDTPMPQTDEHIKIVRNIGISAHIDSGKTTLTERVLYYTGRIREMHEVKGTDGVGATMDSMELERAKGITIKSAATHALWKGYHINVIDTPGHVDFTIEVERSLRVLDGAVFVLCGVAGVQSQSITVDKQMKRYSVPRVLFINKLDRQGANPWKAIEGCRRILQLNLAAVQIPMGLEDQMQGCIDLITREAIYFKGPRGDDVSRGPVPEEYKKEMEAKRVELIETLASVDEPLADLYLENAEISVERIKAAIRKHTIGLKFIPVFLGTALKNKGVQAMLDGVVDYLPNPYEVRNYALDQARDEAKVLLFPDSSKPLVALAFKLEEGQYGQLTYMRIYQGTLRKGETITDMTTGQKHRVPRLCRMHSSEMEPLTEIGAGEIAAMAGVDCASGTTFIGQGGNQRLSMTSMHIPEPVISLAIKPQVAADNAKFSKAINRFQREDPTFRCHQDAESQETIISGMGELHLQIYAERIAREYNVMCDVGQPQVAYRETVTQRGDFNYTHKKQSGGAGQYGKVVGYVEPLPEDHPTPHAVIYENKCSGTAIPPEFFPAIEKGFMESKDKGPLIRAPVQGVRIVLTDGGAHAVDSSEVAFKLAAMYAMAQGFKNAAAILLEPVMAVEVEVPAQFQGGIVASLNRRRGVVQSVDTREGGYAVIRCDVPLKMMFGYSTDLRSSTEGKGEFSMEYKTLQPVSGEDQYDIIKEFEQRRLANEAR